MRSLALFLALLCSPCFAEVKAVIDGPEKAAIGEMVVLSAANAVGDNIKWITPQKLQFVSCNEREIFFSLGQGREGVYRFALIVADTEANIDYVEKLIVIGQPDSPGEPPVDPPDQPTPPSGEVERVRQLSLNQARQLADPATAKRLSDAIQAQADAIKRMCDAQQCPTLDSAKSMMVTQIGVALSQRKGISLTKDWRSLWREPINDLLKSSAGSKNLQSYLTLMRASAVGLSESL